MNSLITNLANNMNELSVNKYPVTPNSLERKVDTIEPNLIWSSDITYTLVDNTGLFRDKVRIILEKTVSFAISTEY